MKLETTIIEKDSKGIIIQISIPFCKDMLLSEEVIQQGVNQVGTVATEYALSVFDTDGSPIQVGEQKYTSKGQVPKIYQCPFGEFELSRHVYQSNTGGSTYCPLDVDARVLKSSTPKFAKSVSCKYSRSGARDVQSDLSDNHGRSISRTYIQDISDAVGRVASSKPWEYSVEVASSDVQTVAFSLDGTCMLLRKDGWRQAMVGSISFYDRGGERLHTTYMAQAPEYGKETFLRDFAKEIKRVKKLYKDKTYIGIADGAKDNWIFLQDFCNVQVLDYYHASEYLTKVSRAFFTDKSKSETWTRLSCHTLKHEKGGVKILLEEMKDMLKKKMSDARKKEIETAITYFTNHLHQMDYPFYLSANFPIGSGVVESACKVIVKQRMCNSGMRWTEESASNVLVLRCFDKTNNKWTQFWNKVRKWGY